VHHVTSRHTVSISGLGRSILDSFNLLKVYNSEPLTRAAKHIIVKSFVNTVQAARSVAFISFVFDISCVYSACFLDCFTELFYFSMVCKLEELTHLYCLQNQPKKVISETYVDGKPPSLLGPFLSTKRKVGVCKQCRINSGRLYDYTNEFCCLT